ncbi:DNA modification methylase [Bradyrhizobium ottawaense]|uniref:DNA methyltransferase n=1 Tax=Bradyrhizobium ottawaense TaxID=931866 RepID=UPI003517C598
MSAIEVAKRHSDEDHGSPELTQVDWNFGSRKSHSDIEGVHPYPAKFITEIPRTLIECLPLPKGTAILDPFCGSGTTLVESQRAGIPSFGVDLNPIACLMSRVKTSAVPPSIRGVLDVVLRNAQIGDDAPVPNIPNLDHWFLKPVQKAISALGRAIAEADEDCRDLLRLALSSIIVRVSNQESDTRYAAVEKDVGKKDVFLGFHRSALRIIDALSQRNYPLTPATVIEGDTITLSAERVRAKIGLVVTSPPYPNAYEYWLYHKYRMWWLGFDPIAVKSREIGARAHFFKTNHHTAEHFEGQMADSFALIKKLMVPGGHACFVVGRSKIHGKIIDNAAIVREAAEAKGFRQTFVTERILSSSRKSFNLSHANIKTETILVFRLS